MPTLISARFLLSQVHRLPRHISGATEKQERFKLRVSQLNGCAYCIDMHSKDLRASGETEQRLYLLDARREAPFYSPRERASLEWAEALTFVTSGHAPDDVFERAKAELSETELVDLSLLVTTINAWNRLSIAFRIPPGTDQPPKHQEA